MSSCCKNCHLPIPPPNQNWAGQACRCPRLDLSESQAVANLEVNLAEARRRIRELQAEKTTLSERACAVNRAALKLGAWMSAALDDPKVCDEMKADIRAWMDTIDFPANWCSCDGPGHHPKCERQSAGQEPSLCRVDTNSLQTSRAEPDTSRCANPNCSNRIVIVGRAAKLPSYPVYCPSCIGEENNKRTHAKPDKT